VAKAMRASRHFWALWRNRNNLPISIWRASFFMLFPIETKKVSTTKNRNKQKTSGKGNRFDRSYLNSELVTGSLSNLCFACFESTISIASICCLLGFVSCVGTGFVFFLIKDRKLILMRLVSEWEWSSIFWLELVLSNLVTRDNLVTLNIFSNIRNYF